MSTKDIGSKGEELAVAHLQKQGYKILATNWQWLHKEIDIIAQKKSFVVFVEVKTRIIKKTKFALSKNESSTFLLFKTILKGFATCAIK